MSCRGNEKNSGIVTKLKISLVRNFRFTVERRQQPSGLWPRPPRRHHLAECPRNPVGLFRVGRGIRSCRFRFPREMRRHYRHAADLSGAARRGPHSPAMQRCSAGKRAYRSGARWCEEFAVKKRKKGDREKRGTKASASFVSFFDAARGESIARGLCLCFGLFLFCLE